MNSNICCRVFKEQIELIKMLPEQERAIILYAAILDAFNQFENQNENQNENAYISVSVSVSDSVSAISKTVLNLLRKNIICKEFSSNYGGKRKGVEGLKRHKGLNATIQAVIARTKIKIVLIAKRMNFQRGRVMTRIRHFRIWVRRINDKGC